MSCRGETAEVPADKLGWTSLREEKASLDCKITKNRPQMGLERLVDLSTISNGSTHPMMKCLLTGREDEPGIRNGDGYNPRK